MRSGLWRLVGPAILVALAVGFRGFQGAAPTAPDLSLAQANEQRWTDAGIQSRIEERLRMDDRIDWELLGVAVAQGHATLYGEVKTSQERGLAALIASTVPGVKGLTNSILVEPAGGPDHTLVKAIWKGLRTVPALDGNETLRVRVKHAVAKLEGTVARSIEKRAAEKAAGSVPGVATVINLIEVRGGASGESIEDRGREKMLQEGVQVQP